MTDERMRFAEDGVTPVYAFSQWLTWEEMNAVKGKCIECGWWASEGRHTNPCRDGEDCANIEAHHPFRAGR